MRSNTDFSPRKQEIAAKLIVRSCRLAVAKGAEQDLGKQIEWHQRKITIGRDDTNDFVLHDTAISNFHCELTLTEDERGYTLEDLGSTNGVWLGDTQIFHARLNFPTELTMGNTVLQFTPIEHVIEKTVHFPLVMDSPFPFSFRSENMKKLWGSLQCLSDQLHNVPVILLGETGVGKTFLAEQIHKISSRSDKFFRPVNCSNISEDLFESEFFGYEKGAFTGAERDRVGIFSLVHQGTLFLDEIGELSMANQHKLLTVLTNKEFFPRGSTKKEPIRVDFRLISATHRNLSQMVADGTFSEALFHRIVVLEFKVPPLRERQEDILFLSRGFLENLLQEFSPKNPAMTRTRLQFSTEVLDLFSQYPWPGNIRELQNTIRSAFVSAISRSTPPYDQITIEDLPDRFRHKPWPTIHIGATSEPLAPPETPLPANVTVPTYEATPKNIALPVYQPPFLPYEDEKSRIIEEFQRAYIPALLHHAGGNVAEAARLSGIARPHLYNIMKKQGIPCTKKPPASKKKDSTTKE